MKTVMEYLQERKEIADHNLFCCSATYAMDRPKEGKEELFEEVVRDCEIVDSLIALVEAQKTPVLVRNTGITVKGKKYSSIELTYHIGERVRAYEKDATTIDVYSLDGQLISAGLTPRE